MKARQIILFVILALSIGSLFLTVSCKRVAQPQEYFSVVSDVDVWVGDTIVPPNVQISIPLGTYTVKRMLHGVEYVTTYQFISETLYRINFDSAAKTFSFIKY